MDVSERLRHESVVQEICNFDWAGMTARELTEAAWAYYHFSIQFRESLDLALSFHADDEKLRHLASEECDTDNLSPWPGVAEPGEKMNHDEFMRRVLTLAPLEAPDRVRLEQAGQAYLTATRALDPRARAMSIASYEDGGLERVFRAMLTAQHWDTPLLAGFRHFLAEHVRFDSDAGAGHGSLSRHLRPDNRILPLWTAFRDVFVTSIPRLRDVVR